MNDFRKKLFRGAKIEDLIVDVDALVANCEETARRADDLGKRRFYEGMAVAYQILSQKLKGKFEYLEEDVVQHLYTGVQRAADTGISAQTLSERREKIGGAVRKCSFCGRGQGEGVHVVPGPGVAICGECVDFARSVMRQAGVSQD